MEELKGQFTQISETEKKHFLTKLFWCIAIWIVLVLFAHIEVQ